MGNTQQRYEYAEKLVNDHKSAHESAIVYRTAAARLPYVASIRMVTATSTPYGIKPKRATTLPRTKGQ